MAAHDAAVAAPAPSASIFKLVYINSLVLLAVVVLFLLHVLGSLRRRSSDKVLHAVLLGAYTLSYALVSYTLGLMQASEYIFNEFPVWAVCLLMLLGGTDNLMAWKLNDVDDWKNFHVKHFLKGVLVVYIVAAYTNNDSPDKDSPGMTYDPSMDATQYRLPLWAILFVNVFQSCMRINSMKNASKYNLLAKNVKPIDDHMKGQKENKLADAATMKGCRYIVAGEHRRRNNVKRTRDMPTDKDVGNMMITTVEKIWECEGSLFPSNSEKHVLKSMRLKDVCLSMALSKMLNRRFAGFEIHKDELDNAHDFVFNGLLFGDEEKRCERTFRVIEVELGFVYDLYYTRYPYLYNKVRHFALCLPIAMVCFCSWLTYVIFKKHKEAKHNAAGDKDNISLCTTLFLMAVVTFLEAFQLYLHVASNWFKVALIRSYVTRPALRSKGCFPVSMIISLALRLKAHRLWENKLGQYCLLQSYDGTRRTSNCIHYVTLWLVDKAKKGSCKRGNLVKLSREVKKAIIDSVIRNKGDLMNGVSRSPPIHTQLLPLQGRLEERRDGDASVGTVTHTILVWHIATTICKYHLDVEVELAKDDAQIPSLSDEDSIAVDTASSLSQYCAYLVAFAPDLLPDHSFDSTSMLDESIKETGALLGGAKTMKEKCDKLIKITESDQLIELSNSNSKCVPLVVEGAQLAKVLRTKSNEDRSLQWKELSDFWADMLLYIAPCDDAQARAHLEALARGGEFITHLWALLTHAGVLKRAPSGSEAV